jgi:hypothetical protein
MLTWLTELVGPRPLGLTRIVVGGAAVIRAVVAWQVLSKLADDRTLRVPYFDWLPSPNLALAVAVASIWLVAAGLFMVGWKVGLTGPVLLASIVFTLALDQQAYSNHLYLMSWLVLLLTVSDAGAGLNVSRTDRPAVRWPILLIMMQASIVYGFSALTKINSEFVSGRVLAGVLRGGVVEFPDRLRTPGLLSALALVVIAVELFIAVFIWRTRFRPAVFVLGLGLHLSITLLMPSTAQLLVFSLEMLALYPLFLGDGALRVGAPESSKWPERIRRFDVLRVVEFDRDTGVEALSLTHRDRTTHAAAAHTRILEHLVPWLWVAPLLRLPGVSRLHERRHRSLASRRELSEASGQ